MNKQLPMEDQDQANAFESFNVALSRAGLLSQFQASMLPIALGRSQLMFEGATGQHVITSQERAFKDRDTEIHKLMITMEKVGEDPPDFERLATLWATLREHLDPSPKGEEDETAGAVAPEEEAQAEEGQAKDQDQAGEPGDSQG